MKEVNNDVFATQANSTKYTGKPYSELDCQGFVEQVLKDCNVRKSDGSPYNWRGSNSMWRNALLWKGSIDECKRIYGKVPVGAWCFIVKNDGGERERGYNDNEGNATHVGIICYSPDKTENCVRDSTQSRTRDGVGYRTLNSFTHIGLPMMITYDFNDNISDVTDTVTKQMALEALETLTKYIKGV